MDFIPISRGMDAEVYSAAERGSFEAVSGVCNWKYQQTPTQNNVLHIHVGKPPTVHLTKTIIIYWFDRIIKKSTVINTEFIEHVLKDEEGYWLLWKQNSNGDTPLHLAAKFGHCKVVKVFLEEANSRNQEELMRLLSMSNNNKDTALHVAARAGNAAVVKLVVEANPVCTSHDEPNDKDETPLYLAAESGNKHSLLVILQTCNALNLGFKGPCGCTALHAAVQWGGPEMVREMVERDRSLIAIRDENGLTPLDSVAVAEHKIELLKILLDNDHKHEKESAAAAYIQDKMGRTPLHIAMLQQNFKALDKLIESCPDIIEMVDNNGQNVLHYAAKWTHRKAIDWVTSQSVVLTKYINDKDKDGNTPLLIFAQSIVCCPDFPGIFNMLNDLLWAYPLIHVMVLAERFPLGRRSNTYERCYFDFEKGMAKDGGELDVKAIKKAAQSRLVVATLIATGSFTAGFTVPGGLIQNEGKSMGMAVFKNKPSFIVFMVSDVIAFVIATYAIGCYFRLVSSTSCSAIREMSMWGRLHSTVSLGALVIAFIAAVCAVSSTWLIPVILIPFLPFFCYYIVALLFSAMKGSRYRYHFRPFRPKQFTWSPSDATDLTVS